MRRKERVKVGAGITSQHSFRVLDLLEKGHLKLLMYHRHGFN